MINLLEEKQPEFQRVILWHTKNKYALYSAYLLIIWRRGQSNYAIQAHYNIAFCFYVFLDTPKYTPKCFFGCSQRVCSNIHTAVRG